MTTPLKRGKNMAALLEEQEITTHKNYSSLSRRCKKGRIISQGYSRQERQDARRETARLFLTGIPLDKKERTNSHGRLRSLLKPHVDSTTTGFSAAKNVTPLPPTFPSQSNTSFYSALESPKRKKKVINKRPSQVQMQLDSGTGFPFFIAAANTNRIVFLHSGHPVICSTVLPYEKPTNKRNRLEGPIPGHHRMRTNSTSIQVDLGEMELLLEDSANELSLATRGLLDSLWINDGDFKTSSNSPLPAKYSRKTPISHQVSFREGLSPPPPDSKSSYTWQFFRENHTPQQVIVNYNPQCLDNREYFIGRHLTILNLTGYRVSLLKYAQESEIKRETNKQFSEVFPHIRITLSKLRSIKRDMIAIGMECGLDAIVLAHGHVYFEKLVLMGKVNKMNRKHLAGVSLILAAKFSSDMKRHEIKSLIEGITDKLRLSHKELMCYEFPTIAALQFSLLTPPHQLQAHYDKIIQDNESTFK